MLFRSESGWHLLGNPYPSALNWNLVRDNNLRDIADALYVFKSSGQYSGTYAAYVNGIGTSGGTNVLPLGQGFFVRATSNTTPGQVGFEDNQRLASATDNNVAFQRPAADLRPLLVLGLRSATASQQTAVYFEAGATAAADDRRYDASALPTTNGLTLATEAGATTLAINGLPALLGQDVRVPLRLAGPSGQYALTTDQLLNLPAAYRAYLLDARSGQATELRAAAVLPLTLAAAAPATGRYSLLFSTQPRVALATAPAQLAALASLAPNPARGSVTLTLPAALRGTSAVPVQIIDGLGRLVRTATLGTGAETLTLALQGLAPGVYAVQARTAAGLVTKRLVVE